MLKTLVIIFILLILSSAFSKNSSLSGDLIEKGNNQWEIIINDDNNDTTIATTFRSWWYAIISGIDTADTATIIIHGEGFSGARFSTPVFSYDGESWIPLKHNEITKMVKSSCNNRLCYKYRISRKFSHSKVHLARHYPYKFEDLYKFLKKFERDKWIKIDTIGYSPLGLPIIELSISNTNIPENKKKRILIHSRTHPSETMSSFVVEGLIESLLNIKNQHILDNLIFNIVPLLNVDGVKLGLSRNNARGYNLEESWFRSELDPYQIQDRCPDEVHILHRFFTKYLESEPDVICAINIHSFNPQYYQKPYAFIFSNFFDWQKYKESGKSLWIKQAKFLKFLNEEYCTPVLGRTNPKTTSTIDKKEFPESWWWINFKDKIMAVTLETTPEQLCINGTQYSNVANKEFGRALAKALHKYFLFAQSINFGSASDYIPTDDLFQYWERVESDNYLK